MVGDFGHAILTIHNFHSLQDLPKKIWRESVREEDHKSRILRSIARMQDHCTHSIVVSVFNNFGIMIINGDKQLLSTEDRESIEKYTAEEGMTILDKSK